MCGIAGIVAFNNKGQSSFSTIQKAVSCLEKRGPDNEGIFTDEHVVLAHRRLSVIDTSDAASQPFTDDSGRYVIVFNGEFFNYREHRNKLMADGVTFKSESDTEVLLQLYIRHKERCLDFVNGFFAFCIYDKTEKTVFIARDRMGIKPLLYYQDDDKLCFASEMKALLPMGIPKEIDSESLHQYLQFNYIPEPWSIYRKVKKLQPGHFINVQAGKPQQSSEIKYYEIIRRENEKKYDYETAQKELRKLLDDAVEKRLISDVPLGCFLSGGIDSSVITALAASKVKNLNTFSIGYKDEPFFDETHFALEVAKMHQTNHHVFKLTNDELFENLDAILDYVDEPFADSAMIPGYIVSKYTRKQVTVALSGDGADEMFAGYQKHKAEWMVRYNFLLKPAVRLLAALMPGNKGSREGALQNKIRQLHRMADGIKLSSAERYIRWCSMMDESEVAKLYDKADKKVYNKRKQILSADIDGKSLNDVMLSDMKLVLRGDMLRKVDMMSMANSLEVRTPFLDYRVVDFAFSLPEYFKITSSMQKRILKETFKAELPELIFQRGKKGFEVPLLKWFQTHLKSKIENVWLNDKFIREQGMFNPDGIAALKQQLFQKPEGETEARMWALIVFQNWWLKYHSIK